MANDTTGCTPPGDPSKSKALNKGKGANLPFDTLTNPIAASPMVAQLRNNGNGLCMQSSFATAITNTDTQYKAKQ